MEWTASKPSDSSPVGGPTRSTGCGREEINNSNLGDFDGYQLRNCLVLC